MKTYTMKIVVKMEGKKSICNRIYKEYVYRLGEAMKDPATWTIQKKSERGEKVDIRWGLYAKCLRRPRKPNAQGQRT
jgi:hypothetical protein